MVLFPSKGYTAALTFLSGARCDKIGKTTFPFTVSQSFCGKTQQKAIVSIGTVLQMCCLGQWFGNLFYGFHSDKGMQ